MARNIPKYQFLKLFYGSEILQIVVKEDIKIG